MKLSEKLQAVIDGSLSEDFKDAMEEMRQDALVLEQGIPTIHKMNLCDGDVIVLKSKEFLPEVHKERIAYCIKKVAPNNKAILLDNGVEIEIISGDDK